MRVPHRDRRDANFHTIKWYRLIDAVLVGGAVHRQLGACESRTTHRYFYFGHASGHGSGLQV